MKRRPLLPFVVSLLALCVLSAPAARSVIVIGPDGRNLSPPTGDLANSGWQYEGQWGKFLGTPIAPHFFVTAKHVGGSVGQVFWYQGQRYTTVESFPNPYTDLAVWRVEETLPSYAPLFTGTDEIGRSIVVIGRGTARGSAIHVKGQLRGWYWGPGDHAQSWGTDTVVGINTDVPPLNTPKGKSLPLNQKLVFTFDARDGAANTCMVSTGDSGGGVFTRVGKQWQLIGLVWGMENGFCLTPKGETFNAALYDIRDLYRSPVSPAGTVPPFLAQSPEPIPGIWYATRLAPTRDFLRQTLATASRPPLTPAGPARLLRFAGFAALWLVTALLTAALARRRVRR